MSKANVLPRPVACMEYLLGSDYILCDMGARQQQPAVNMHLRERVIGQ